jgi:hypothetical protein
VTIDVGLIAARLNSCLKLTPACCYGLARRAGLGIREILNSKAPLVVRPLLAQGGRLYPNSYLVLLEGLHRPRR